MRYQIQRFRKVDHATVKASFDISFDAVLVRGFSLIQTADGGRFISPPSEKYTKDGQQKFKDIAVFTDDLVKADIYIDVKKLYEIAPEAQPQAGSASGYHNDDDVPFI